MRSRIALTICAFLVLAGCREEVYTDLTQRDANEMTALLISEGIDARRIVTKDDTFTVEVAEADFARSVQLISASGLPRPNFASMVDVFNDGSMISSPQEERARLAYALSQELSQTVSEIDGVTSARVHLASSSLDPLGRKLSKATASVALHHDNNLETDGLVPRIKMLVSHAVDDLAYDDVLVALFPVRKSQGVGAAESGPIAPAAPSSESLLTDLQWPDSLGFGSDDRPRQIQAPASMGRGTGLAGMNPALAAVLGGGLLILLIAARSLFDRRRSPSSEE